MKFNEYKEKVFKENPEVKEEYYKLKQQKTVVVDELFCEMMNYAVRYSCGRRTYAALSTANYVHNLADKLNTQTLLVILRDIEEQEKISLGDEIDERGWIKLKNKIKKILEERGFFESHNFEL